MDGLFDLDPSVKHWDDKNLSGETANFFVTF